MIQPEERSGGFLPYPWYVDSQAFEVGRQDFWEGSAERLVGFASSEDPCRVVVRPEAFAGDPGSCVGLCPVFAVACDEDEDGAFDGERWTTWVNSPIERAVLVPDVEGGEVW